MVRPEKLAARTGLRLRRRPPTRWTGTRNANSGPSRCRRRRCGPPGYDPKYHKFHRVQGGFLAVTLKREGARSRILFEHRSDGRGRLPVE